MPVELAIPDELAERLRRRAAQHQRSLDGVVVGILKASVGDTRRLTPAEFVAEAEEMGFCTPDEATAIIRKDRDAGHCD